MKLKPIINSALETDLYKFNMGNIIFKRYNDRTTTWCFKCRNSDVKFTPEMVKEIREQIDWFCNVIRFTNEELEWLKKTCPWLSAGYLNYLKHWSADRSTIFINEGNIQAYNDCGLAIEARGTWLDTSMFEIPVLAIVNEVYFAFKYGVGAKDIEFQKRTMEKFSKFFNHVEWECYLNDDNEIGAQKYRDSHPYEVFTFSEFGLRRRYSAAMHDWLIKFIVDQKIPGFVGTSNVYLAKKYGVKPIGTCAHEMAMTLMTDVEYNPSFVNARLMETWTDEYGVENGIYLTDVIGREAFLMDFNKKYATLFSGLRHDSGDPIEWGEAMIAKYKELGINPMTKTLLFSDSLNFEKATKIKKHFEGKCNIAFGIGTYLAGIQDEKPLNIVMKVTNANGRPACKLTDNIEKAMGNLECIDYVRRAVEWKIKYCR